MATVYIGSDHAGLELKAALVKRLSEKGHDVHDLGPATTESCDYPVYAKGVCGKVLADAGNATPRRRTRLFRDPRVRARASA